MALTLRFTQLNRKQKANGEIPIYLRITENRKTKYLSTAISVLPKDWNQRNEEIRKSHILYKKYNAELERFKLKAESEKSDLRIEGELDASKLKNRLKFNASKSIFEFGEEYREVLKNEERYWEHRHFGVVLNDIEAMGELNSLVSNIDQNFIERFRDYLFKELGNGNNTVRKKLQRFKGMTKEALKQGYLTSDPYQFIESIKRTTSTKAKLGPEQIEAILNVKLEKSSFQWHVRNYFMFSYYAAGIRFSDLCTLTPLNIIDGRLRYSMRKTGNEKNIKLRKEHLDILMNYNTSENGYIFPLLNRVYADEFMLKKKISSCNVLANKALKSIAKKAGISENISFHVSRHSFAHNALKSGMNIYSISKALSHSDLKITEQYLKSFDEEMLDSEMDKFFEKN